MSLVAAWRDPAYPSARPPLAILFHGRGSNEEDLLPCVDALPGELAAVALRGPLPLDFGYTWFENRGLGRPVGESLRASVATIQSWLDALDPQRYDPERVFLFGFSAGMLIAGALLADRPERFRGAVLLSGTLPWDCDLAPPAGRFARKAVFYARGTGDEVIPADLVERSVRYLEDESEADLTVRLYPMDHVIADEELADVTAWMQPLLAP